MTPKYHSSIFLFIIPIYLVSMFFSIIPIEALYELRGSRIPAFDLGFSLFIGPLSALWFSALLPFDFHPSRVQGIRYSETWGLRVQWLNGLGLCELKDSWVSGV